MLSGIMLVVPLYCYAGCHIFNGMLSIIMLIAVLPSAVAPLKPMVETIWELRLVGSVGATDRRSNQDTGDERFSIPGEKKSAPKRFRRPRFSTKIAAEKKMSHDGAATNYRRARLG